MQNNITEKIRFLAMKNNDNVAVAMSSCKKNNEAIIIDYNNEEVCKIVAQEDITFGNKIALNDITTDSLIIKYNAPIGTATRDIKKGELVHVHNVVSNRIDIPKEIKKEIIRQMNIQV